VLFRCRHKSFMVLFWVNIYRKPKDKTFLSFRRLDKWPQASFQASLNCKRKDKLFASFGARTCHSRYRSVSTLTASRRTSCSYGSGASPRGSKCLSGSPQCQAQGLFIPIVPAPGQLAPGVGLGQRQGLVQGQVVSVVLAQGQVAPGVVPGQPQPPITQPQAQRQVAQAADPMQGQGIRTPKNTPCVAV